MRQSNVEIERLDVQGSMRAIDFRPGGETPKILIADDDPLIVRLLADHCARLGFKIHTAANGITALLKATRLKPDVLVIDVNMPEVDGLSVCAHLLDRGNSPANVIVMTGGRNPHTPERCEGLGAYCARKGPNFWNDLEGALAEIHPAMASRIQQSIWREAAPQIRRRPHGLLIDDDDDVHRLLASRLRKCGMDVDYALSARHGFQVACRDEPAVIITDYFMPNGDAQFLLTRLRTTAATRNIPVIVLSGRTLDEVTVRGLQREICGHAGAVQILRKSQDISALLEALKKFCGFEHDADLAGE